LIGEPLSEAPSVKSRETQIGCPASDLHDRVLRRLGSVFKRFNPSIYSASPRLDDDMLYMSEKKTFNRQKLYSKQKLNSPIASTQRPAHHHLQCLFRREIVYRQWLKLDQRFPTMWVDERPHVGGDESLDAPMYCTQDRAFRRPF